ncbi:MAG: hypothetical protein HYU66_19815 [Armatimonadetes bacterium]|nr:hypothetical protein [Armatimonadota bacterium]
MRAWGKGLLGVAALTAVSLWAAREATAPLLPERIPSPALPKPNARDWYLRAGRLLVAGDAVKGAAFPSREDKPTSLEAKAALLRRNEAPLRLVRLGMAHPYGELPDRSLDAHHPRYAELRQLGALLRLDGQVREAGGDWDGALADALDGIRYGVSLQQGTSVTLYEGLRAQASAALAARRLVPKLSAPGARTAAAAVRAAQARELPCWRWLEEQKWMALAAYHDAMQRERWAHRVNGLYAVSFCIPDWQVWLRGRRGLLRDIERHYNLLIANEKRAYLRRANPLRLDADELVLMLTDFSAPDRERFALVDAATGMLAVELAVHAWRLDHTAFPAQLADLVPRYLPSLPDDPFALAGTYGYVPAGRRYRLYSVGPDGRDDGGAVLSPEPYYGQLGHCVISNWDRIVDPSRTGDIGPSDPVFEKVGAP